MSLLRPQKRAPPCFLLQLVDTGGCKLWKHLLGPVVSSDHIDNKSEDSKTLKDVQ
jgi:hypothetical protein